MRSDVMPGNMFRGGPNNLLMLTIPFGLTQEELDALTMFIETLHRQYGFALFQRYNPNTEMMEEAK